ncbi:Protein NRDE2-like [Oopsacas minuta]|uniref:Protein NRDE2-like n=1 Tax=Oopsacas minuta TaxID=111878 RepID=A0AAV7K3P0_9METZ|nr:Protein NRDE2-like [Oopsacas minuta]
MRGPCSPIFPSEKTPFIHTNLDPHSWLVNKSYIYNGGIDNEKSSPKLSRIKPILTTTDFLTKSNTEIHCGVVHKPGGNLFYKDVFDNRKDTSLFELYSLPNFDIPRYALVFGDNCLSLKGHMPMSSCDELPVKSGDFMPQNKRYYLYPNDDSATRTFNTCSSNLQIPITSLLIPITPIYLEAEELDDSSRCEDDSKFFCNFLKSFPNSISIWLHHNSTILQVDRIPPNIYTPYSAFDFEVCLKFLEITLSQHPKNISFISTFMSLYSYKYDYQQVINKWNQFLFIVVHSSRLWNEFINYISQSFEHYYFEDVVLTYNMAFERLIAICEGDLLSTTPELDAENNLVFLMIKFCYFLKNAGYQERSLSSIIALIEINVMYKLNAHDNKCYIVDNFISSWNRDSSVIFNCVNIHPYLSLTLFEEHLIQQDSNREVGGIFFNGKSWTEAEHIRSETWSFLPKCLHNKADAIDNERLICHPQLTSYFFSIHNSDNLFQLLLHTMILFGIPISMTSRVKNTFLAELGMVVEIDAISWLSLSPLHYSGTLIVNSTDTQNFIYSKAPLTYHQMTPVINILNHILPVIDLEYQTIILITWFEYEINCLNLNVADKEINKFVRKQIKSILALEIHKNNLELWSAYLILHSYVCTLKEAFKIPTNIISQYTNSYSLLERLLCTHILLSICAIVEARFNVSSSGLKLYFLDCLASECSPKFYVILKYLEQNSNLPTYSYPEYIRVKQTIWLSLVSSFENNSTIENPIIPMLYSYFFLQSEIIMLKPLELEAYCMNLKIINDFVAASNIFPTRRSKNRIMQCILYKAIILIMKYIGLRKIPYNLANIINNFLLPFMSYNTCLYSFLMQSYMSFNTKLLFYTNTTISGYVGQQFRLLSLITQELDLSFKLNLLNMLKGTFEDALIISPFNLILFFGYMDFLNFFGFSDDIRSFFLQAIRKAPGVKHLYMQYLSIFSKDTQFALSTMEDKGIRIFCPMEEYLLLHNTKH